VKELAARIKKREEFPFVRNENGVLKKPYGGWKSEVLLSSLPSDTL
jgi:hypothetical protein